MPTTIAQRIFDQLLGNCICTPDGSGWARDTSETHPSITVTSEVVLALIDAVMSSAIIEPDDFSSRLKGPIEFIKTAVMVREDSSLDLSNYVRALSAYLFYLRFITPPGDALKIDASFKDRCVKGIFGKFVPDNASLVERWLYVNGCKDILEASGEEFSALRQASEIAQKHLEDEVGRKEFDSYEAAIYLDALTPRRLSNGHAVKMTTSIQRCIEKISLEKSNFALAQVRNDRPDSYKVYTPAFVIKSFAMLRPLLDGTSRRFFYEMVEAVYETITPAPLNFRDAHLLRGFVHAGIEPDDAKYIGTLLLEVDGLKENLRKAREKRADTDIEAIETAAEKKLFQIGRPTGRFFSAYTPLAYSVLFGGILFASYLLMRLSTNKWAFLISFLAFSVSVIFIAFQAYKVDRRWDARSKTEKVPLMLFFVIFAILAISDVVGVVSKFDEVLFSQLRTSESSSLQAIPAGVGQTNRGAQKAN